MVCARVDHSGLPGRSNFGMEGASVPCRGLSLRRSTRRGACRRHPSASARVWHVRPGPARTRCPAAARQPCATARRVPGPTGFHQGGRVGKNQSGAKQGGDLTIVSPCISPPVLYSPVCRCCPLWLPVKAAGPEPWARSCKTLARQGPMFLRVLCLVRLVGTAFGKKPPVKQETLVSVSRLPCQTGP